MNIGTVAEQSGVQPKTIRYFNVEPTFHILKPALSLAWAPT